MSWQDIERRVSAHFPLCAILIASLGTALFLLTARGSWFFEDDFRNLAEASESQLGWSFLVSPIVGARLAPGHRLLDWVVVNSPIDQWQTALLLGAVCVFAACSLTVLTARRISGSALVALIAASAFALWVGWGRAGLWWAASAHILPSTVFSIATVWLALSWLKQRRWLLLAGSSACALIAMAFSMRAMAVPLVLFLLLAVSMPTDRRLTVRSFLARTMEMAPALLPTFLVVGVYTALDLRTESFLVTDPATVGQYLSYLADWMTAGLWSTTANGRAPSVGASSLAPWVGLAVLVLMMATTIRNRRSALTWAGIYALIAFFGVQVGHRLSQAINEGDGYGYLISELRFHEGELFLLSLLVPAAWKAAGSPTPESTRQLRIVAVAGSIVVVAWATIGYVTREEVLRDNPGALARATNDELKRSLEAQPRSALSKLSVVDTTLPPAFIPVAFGGGYQGGLPRFLGTFYPDLASSALRPSPLTFSIGSGGELRRLDLRKGGTRLTAEGRCPRSTASRQPGRKASLASFGLAKGKARDRERVLDIIFPAGQGARKASISFLPGVAGNSPVELALPRRSSTRRVLIPAGARTVTVTSSDDTATCPKVTLLTTRTR